MALVLLSVRGPGWLALVVLGLVLGPRWPASSLGDGRRSRRHWVILGYVLHVMTRRRETRV